MNNFKSIGIRQRELLENIQKLRDEAKSVGMIDTHTSLVATVKVTIAELIRKEPRCAEFPKNH